MKNLAFLSALLVGMTSTSWSQCSQFPVLDLGPDTILCPGQTLTVNAPTGYDLYSWNVPPGFQPSITVSSNSSLILNVVNYTANLVVNGDFEQGNTGFTSAYVVGTGGTWGQLSNPGTYAVTTNPNLVHSNFMSCSDVGTAAPGNMLVVNGSNTPNTVVWSETITVQPNTDYSFSAWVTSVENISQSNVASLQFYINSVQIGAVWSPTLNGCDWQQFYQVWNSAAATSAVISIVAQVSSGNNDFAIDDIMFNSVCTQTDTLNIVYDPFTVDAGPNASFCENEPETITATSTIPNVQFTWSTNETTATISPATSGMYYVTAPTPNGCIAKDSVQVNITAMPWTFDTIASVPTACGASNGAVYVLMNGSFVGQPVYTWSGPGPNSPNQINASVWQNLTTGWYYIDVSNQGCHRTDSVFVAPLNPPVASLSGNPLTGTYPLVVDFTNSSQNATNYQWSFGNGNTTTTTDLSGQQQTYDTTGVYQVVLIATQGNCSDTAILSVFVTAPIPPPTIVPVSVQVPNIFTPNGDNVNDVFELKLLNIASIHTVISNRWGGIMFETDDNPIKWDGNDAPDGLYFYHYEAVGAQGENIVGTGFIQLIR